MCSCSQCLKKDAYIMSLEKHIKALETVLKNSERSLAAEGRHLRKTSQLVKAAKQQLEEK